MISRRQLKKSENKGSSTGDKYANLSKKEQIQIRKEKFQFFRPSNMTMWDHLVAGIVTSIFVCFLWCNIDDDIKTDLRSILVNPETPTEEPPTQTFSCNDNYVNEVPLVPGCTPQKCGRLVSDKLVTSDEINVLLGIVKRGMEVIGPSNGITMLDLHSGALSYGNLHINVYSSNMYKAIYSLSDLKVYKTVKEKIHNAICTHFKIAPESLYYSYPTYFSRLNTSMLKVGEKIFWAASTDERYPGIKFQYGSIIYLSGYHGGRFKWIDEDGDISELPTQNLTLETRRGRVFIFTPALNNYHYVEELPKGIRYALTLGFTCDSEFNLPEPYWEYV